MGPKGLRYIAPGTVATGMVALLVSCTPAPDPLAAVTEGTPGRVAPTVQAAATRVAPTVQAVVPTVQALAPTAQAVATAVTVAAPVTIVGVQPGTNDTTITLANTSAQTVDLGGAQLRVGNVAVTLPAGLDIQPGETVTIHTARGTGDQDDVFLGDEAAALAAALRPGARVALVSDQGQTLAEFQLALPVGQPGEVVATPLPTVQALATQVAPAVAPVATAVTAASPLVFTGVQLDLRDTTFTVRNQSQQVVDLTGLDLRVGDATVSLPSGLRLQPGATVTIHTARGTGDEDDIFLGDEAATLLTALRPGARVALVGANDNVLAQFTIPGA